MYGINQLMPFAKGTDREIKSWMKRMCLAEFPTMAEPCEEFNKLLTDPEFLDEIYSYLIQADFTPIRKESKVAVEEWIQATMKRWYLSSNPVMRYLSMCFEYTEDADSVLNCHYVADSIRDLMENDDLIVPNDIQADITENLKSMKIYRNARRGKEGEYSNILRRKDENNQFILPDPPKTALPATKMRKQDVAEWKQICERIEPNSPPKSKPNLDLDMEHWLSEHDEMN